VIERLGLGTAALGVPYGAPHAERDAPPAAEAAATLEAALAAGIRLIDTAPTYGGMEALVGAVAGDSDCVIATKVAGDVRASAENSLRALRRDALDLLLIHNATAATIERGEMTSALAELRREGLIRAAGATTYGEVDARAAIACDELDVVQVAFSALDRRAERVVRGAGVARGAATTVIAGVARGAATTVIARSALLRGVLTARGRDLNGRFAPLREAADAFRAAAGVTWEELPGAAVAYCVRRPWIARTLLGPRDRRELAALIAGATRFAGAEVADGWQRELPEDLLDPRHWEAA
jgi:aryl-alcohol dehydrogenase-like predicted oxidoreductase